MGTELDEPQPEPLPRRRRKHVEPRMLNHRTVARMLDIDTETLRDWVATGEWPEPHAVIRQTWLFDRAVIDHWFKTGIWLGGARFKKGAGRGRTRPPA